METPQGIGRAAGHLIAFGIPGLQMSASLAFSTHSLCRAHRIGDELRQSAARFRSSRSADLAFQQKGDAHRAQFALFRRLCARAGKRCRP